MTASDPHPPRKPRGFAMRRLQDLMPRRPRRDWDVRFVTATLLFYGLVGASFFLVSWLNADEPPAGEYVTPQDEESARQPYRVPLPQPLPDRPTTDDPPESR